jgi:hypothetical protein
MTMLKKLVLLVLLFCLAACEPSDKNSDDAPLLVREVTVVPTDLSPTRFLSPTPLQATEARPTGEVVSPLNQVTVDARYIVVTPTLPPSKTPTVTPTQTQTPTVTASPSMTNTATSTAFLLPTNELIPITQPAAQNSNTICDSSWFFIEPRPPACPMSQPTASNGVYQQFQNGTMIWVGSGQAIYVLYNDSNQPRWQVFRDYFDENNPSMLYLDGPPQVVGSSFWTPRRGFGLLWQNDLTIQNRLGAAIEQWEQPYSVQIQTASDGSIFLSTPRGFVFSLFSGGVNWNQYSSYNFQNSTNPSTNPIAVPIGGS